MTDKKDDKKGSQESPIRGIVPRSITQEMRESYLDYAMSVITARALPDARDGLKPVHRRILFAMREMGLTAGAKSKKSAAVVGDVLGKYHPHGDVAVYDAMVKMAQDFVMRYPLVLGQGNFGSIDGDSAAAMRYCVTGDTLIPTDKGMVPIEQISEKKNESISTKVLSARGHVNVANKWFDSGEHNTISIKTNRGYKLTGSYNHPVLTWCENTITGEPHFEWKLLSKVQESDVLVLDRTPGILWPEHYVSLQAYKPIIENSRIHQKQLPKKFTEDLAFIIGLLVSEGSISEKKIEFCNSDLALMEEFRVRWQRVFPDCRLHIFDRKPSSYGKKQFQIAEIHSQHVIHFLRSVGLEPLRSKHKVIPFTVLRSPKSVVAAFLRAYFEGDGGISFSSKMTELSAISTSVELLDQIQILLLRFGIASTRRHDRYRNTEKLYIRGLRDYRLFESEIGFASIRKINKLSDAIARLHKEYSSSDYIPFVSDYVRSVLSGAYGSHRQFAIKHNFDRYPNLKRNGEMVLSAVKPAQQIVVSELFKNLSTHQYLFDVVTEIKKAGVARVFSVRVDSKCHSFVGNGFINHNTEARMTKLAEEILTDIEKDTVDFVPNYDNSKKEPVVLPATFPNLLANGTLGIAVGMATNIPPHNLREICDATSFLIDNPKATTEDLLQFVQGPDFPTGCIAFNQKDIAHAYATGRGGVVVRGEAEVVEGKKGDYQIIITSVPFRVNKADLLQKIANLVHEKKIEGIKDVRDESTTDIRVAIDLKGSAHPQTILNSLYKHTQLEEIFHYNVVALVDGVPQTLSLKGLLESFVSHRKEVVTRRTRYDLTKAKDREHILEGLKKALDHIDKIIALIKKSADVAAAHAGLMKTFKFSDRQATAILEMRLQKLAGLERKKIEDELKAIRALIAELEELLKSEKKMMVLIKKEISNVSEKYGDDRRTKIVKREAKVLSPQDLVADENSVLVLTRGGYIKRTNPSEYRKQKRGGVGVVDLNTKEEDVVSQFLTASTHSDILFFTDRGKAYQLKMYDIPEGKRATRGKSVMNFLAIEQGEVVNSVLAMPKSAKKGEGLALVMVTKNGTVKKTDAEHFYEVRRSGLLAIKLDKGDELISAHVVHRGEDVMVVTAKGQSIRFKEKDVRSMGRTAAGVRGIKLNKDDSVIGSGIVPKDEKAYDLFVLMSSGYGKRTPLKEYKIQGRGGSGIKTAQVTAKTGALISAAVVIGNEEIVAVSQKGQVIRTELGEIRSQGRQTQGVRVMKLHEGDKIAACVALGVNDEAES